MRLADTLSHLELFVTAAPDLGHVNCSSKHQVKDLSSVASTRIVTRKEKCTTECQIGSD
jgi:hypothetical protein